MSKPLWKLNLTGLCLLGVAVGSVLIVRSGARVTSTVLAQEENPSVTKLIETWPTRTEPVSLLDIRVGNQRVRPAAYNGRGHPLGGTPFQGDENWLARVSFTLRNRTSEVIIQLILSIGFPETRTKDAREVWVPIELITKHPDEASPDDTGTHRAVPFLFAPSSAFRVSLSDYLGPLRERVEDKQPLSSINTAVIIVHYVRFEEGHLSWSTSNGYCLEPEGIRGGGCYRMEDTFFPGVLPPEKSKLEY
jgi:hypothetical protein